MPPRPESGAYQPVYKDAEGKLITPAPTAAAGYGLLATIGVVVLAVALAILGLGAANYAATKDIAPKCDGNCKQANFDLKNVYYTALKHYAPGSQLSWSDLTVAVGNDDDNGRIMISANPFVAILRKDTQEMISITPLATFFGGSILDNTMITFDPIHKRFFASSFLPVACEQYGVIVSPPNVSGPMC